MAHPRHRAQGVNLRVSSDQGLRLADPACRSVGSEPAPGSPREPISSAGNNGLTWLGKLSALAAGILRPMLLTSCSASRRSFLTSSWDTPLSLRALATIPSCPSFAGKRLIQGEGVGYSMATRIRSSFSKCFRNAPSSVLTGLPHHFPFPVQDPVMTKLKPTVRLGSLPAAAFLPCFFIGWSPFAPHRVRCRQHHSLYREASRLIPSEAGHYHRL